LDDRNVIVNVNGKGIGPGIGIRWGRKLRLGRQLRLKL